MHWLLVSISRLATTSGAIYLVLSDHQKSYPPPPPASHLKHERHLARRTHILLARPDRIRRLKLRDILLGGAVRSGRLDARGERELELHVFGRGVHGDHVEGVAGGSTDDDGGVEERGNGVGNGVEGGAGCGRAC